MGTILIPWLFDPFFIMLVNYGYKLYIQNDFKNVYEYNDLIDAEGRNF